MNVDTFGDGEDLLWVMGWGNRADSRHERWFVDRLVDAGYRVHAVELPTNGTDLVRDYLDPLRSYREEVGDHSLVSHSMGGLVTAHLQPDQPAVYLSPWWGMADEQGLVERLVLSLPVSRPFIPAPVEPELLGGLAEEQDATAPSKMSPAWVRTMAAAQDSLPDVDPDDVVFYSSDDEIVSPGAIEAHAAADQLERYDGGHELFASEGREAAAERVVDALDER